jgi:succinate dehydrogenase / fumarate reductase cytochrome b subunit
MDDTIPKPRPVYRNIHVTQIASYRLPPSGWVSILHRISGFIMFLLLPLLIWFFDNSITSEVSFDRFRSAFTTGLGIFPGWFVKLIVLGLIWAYLHHFIAGVRHLWMDVSHHATTLHIGRASALFTLVSSLLLTLLLGAKLFF